MEFELFRQSSSYVRFSTFMKMTTPSPNVKQAPRSGLLNLFPLKFNDNGYPKASSEETMKITA